MDKNTNGNVGGSLASRSPGNGDSNGVTLLDEIMPRLQKGFKEKLPKSIGSLLEQLGLKRYETNFTNEEFHDVPTILLCTEDDLKDIGLPVGPRVKIRNWIESRKAKTTEDAA